MVDKGSVGGQECGLYIIRTLRPIEVRSCKVGMVLWAFERLGYGCLSMHALAFGVTDLGCAIAMPTSGKSTQKAFMFSP
jgi:hypothetical protein